MIWSLTGVHLTGFSLKAPALRQTAVFSLLRSAYKLLVYGQLWIALGAALFVATSRMLLHLPPLNYQAYGAFFGTLCVYYLQLFVRMLGVNESRPGHLHLWLSEHMFLGIMLFLASVAGSLWSFSIHPLEQQLVLCGAVTLALLYAWPLWRKGNLKLGLREIPYTKAIWISVVWVAVGIINPLLDASLPINQWPVGLICERLFFLMLLVILFDIKDLSIDFHFQRTLPQLLGARYTRHLAMALLAASTILALTQPGMPERNQPMHYAMLFSYLATIPIIWQSKATKPEPYFLFYVDGALIFQGLFALIAHLYIN